MSRQRVTPRDFFFALFEFIGMVIVVAMLIAAIFFCAPAHADICMGLYNGTIVQKYPHDCEHVVTGAMFNIHDDGRTLTFDVDDQAFIVPHSSIIYGPTYSASTCDATLVYNADPIFRGEFE